MYTYKTFHQPAQMLRSFLLLSFLTICGAFAPSMCQLEPKKPIPPALKQLKYDIPIPVKPKLKLSDIPLPPHTKIIYIATFTRKGIVIRPKRIHFRRSRWSQLGKALVNLKKQIAGFFALARK